MNKMIFKSLMAFLLVGVATLATAQDGATDNHKITINIPEVAILDLESATSKDITLAPTKPTEAGSALDFSGATDETLWLNYSSIVGSTTDASRTINVKVSAGTLPAGINLKLTAAADAGTGAGTTGTPGSTLTLSTTAQDLITGIGSCYTGTPHNNGHKLTYALESAGTASYGDIDFDDATTVTVLYTITE